MKKIISIFFLVFIIFQDNFAENAAILTSKQLTAKDTANFIVSSDGSGDFKTIQAAINAVPDFRKKRTVIFIKNGIYTEKLLLPSSKQFVSLIGENAQKTIIAYGDWAQKKSVFNEEIGTSGSATFYAGANNFYAENITFQNTAGPIGQAVAVHVSGDKCIFKACRFLGFQDTLYTYDESSRQYYKNCYIEGSTDFIFGSSTAVFDECVIHSLRESYITAASTPETGKYGYLFVTCKLTADTTVKKMYLGRPWRKYAKTVFRECDFGNHIHPEGWHNWNKPEAEKTTFYGEYNNTGLGANVSKRVKWSKQLTDIQAQEWTIEKVLAGNDGWNPTETRVKYE